MIEETEESWFGHYSPADWRGFLSELISPRKQRLFAVACCRRVWEALPTET